MKKLIIVRHGRKDGEMIANEQIEEIIANGIPAIDNNLPAGDFIFVRPGSALVRTRQTIEAWEQYLTSTGTDTWLLDADTPFSPDSRFGSDEMFAKFGPLKESFKETGDWLKTLQKEAPCFLAELQSGMLTVLDEILKWLDEDETMVMAGHTPMIEILAQAINPDAHVSPLKELEGFIFEQEGEGGPITIRRVQ